MTTLLIALASVASAQEVYASEPRELVFSDVHAAFSAFTFDTGYLPSSSSPISVRFHITPQGGVVTDFEAVSYLEWGRLPDGSMEHTLEAVPGSGWFGIDAEIEVAAEVHLDIFGLYTGTIPLWGEQIRLSKGVTFDTLLLEGSGEAPLEVVLNEASLIDPLEFAITVFTGLELLLTVDIYPQLRAAIAGEHVEADFPHIDVFQELEGQWVTLPAPGDQPGELPFTATYTADLTSVLSLVIAPAVALDTFLGGFTLVEFPIPVDLVDSSSVRPFEPQFAAHPLPAVGPLEQAWDFGDVDLGALANWPLVWENLGELGLEGKVSIEGPDSFSVWPDYLYAPPDRTDGLTVTFAPKLEGPQEAWLVIASNDPAIPEARVKLTGNGFVEPEPEPGPTDNTPPSLERESTQVKTCGCQSASGSGGPWLLLLPLLMIRRRTNFTRR